MNVFKTLSILLLFTACTKSPKVAITEKSTEPQYFFDFDEVIHFRIDKITETLADSMFVSRDRNNEAKRKFRILYNYESYPSRLNDSTFLKELSALYKFQQKIPSSKMVQMSNIFSERKTRSETSTTCDPKFRDVLIFKKNGSLSGVAKICFQCGKHYIIGSKRNTLMFGQNREFEELKKLLEK